MFSSVFFDGSTAWYPFGVGIAIMLAVGTWAWFIVLSRPPPPHDPLRKINLQKKRGDATALAWTPIKRRVLSAVMAIGFTAGLGSLLVGEPARAWMQTVSALLVLGAVFGPTVIGLGARAWRRSQRTWRARGG